MAGSRRRADCHDAPRHNHDKFLTSRRLDEWHRTYLVAARGGGKVTAGRRVAGLVEVGLGRFRVFRHFGVDDLAERIGVERNAAVVAVFRLEAPGVAANVGYACFLE